MSAPIPQMEPWFGSEEKQALADYMDCGGWLTEFRQTAAFEQAIADYVGVKHCITSNNGTTALIMIALALGLGPGDEVIVPNFTMIATPNSVVITGATPVFVDVEADTLCLDIEKVEAAITARTRAILFVNANGRSANAGIGAFTALAERHGLILIEDSCQALGSRFDAQRHMGTVGLAGAFSFSVPKVITTGQGGVVVTNDDAFADKLRRLKDFGRSGGGNDIHDSIGYNFKFTELQAVVGIEQMKKLAWRVERKKQILARYQANLEGVDRIHFFNQDLSLTTPWFIDTLADRRDELREYLRGHDIGSRPMYPPINKQLAFGVPGEHPVSNLVGEKGLWLPSAAQLSDEQIDRITDKIRTFYGS